MPAVHARAALLPDGWADDVCVRFTGGRIDDVRAGIAPRPGDDRRELLIPALHNVHSHAFQRAMAGFAERRGPTLDSFWSWRETMYRFALALTPDDAEAVAAFAFMEMLEAGFARVGEFHYLHHDRDGAAYANLAEMAERIVAAAQQTGIGLTLLPVFYAQGDFHGAPPSERQRRFLTSLDVFQRLHAECARAVAGLAHADIGVAPHSLRAVTPDALTHVLAAHPAVPVHIHIAEQLKEVEDCIAWSGARPVQWLMDHAEVDARWCLVHATHMLPAETLALARSGAVVGLCPITESNLGDGIFDGARFAEAGGRFGVGTDSNIQIAGAEELRHYEYTQRLALRARNVLGVPGGSTGRALFNAALAGGAQALGQVPGLRAGARADMIALDAQSDALAGRRGDDVLDAWIFCGGRVNIDTVWSGGEAVVTAGRHRDREKLSRRFRSVMSAISL